jgi:hypothetical protein
MTPEQILEALKHLHDAWYRTSRSFKDSDMEKDYAEQIQYLLAVQRSMAATDIKITQ